MRTIIKWDRAFWAVAMAAAVWGALGGGGERAYGQKPAPVISASSAVDQDFVTVDAQRGAIDRFLDSHPEIAREVIDHPAAMSDPNFLHDHPEMQAFLEAHPMVKADPRAFISPRAWKEDYHPPEVDTDGIVTGVVLICMFLVMLAVFRVVSENRRWNRAFKMHEEVHTKLIEKFASGQDFGSYLQSDAGRRLLEWTPPAVDTLSRGLPPAVSRILWSLQAGLVLALTGFGLLMLRGHMEPHEAEVLLVFGTLGVTLGAGFGLSGVVSYGLSKHLGLINPEGHGAEAMLKH